MHTYTHICFRVAYEELLFNDLDQELLIFLPSAEIHSDLSHHSTYTEIFNKNLIYVQI